MGEKKVFNSIFADEFQSLISLKRSLGFTYITEETAFLRLDRYFIKSNLYEKTISKEICELWCEKRSYESPRNHCSRISILRVFCKYLRDIGYTVYIPPEKLVKRPSKYDAHIYSDDELKRFFVAVDNSKSISGECPYRSQVMPLFFRILYTSGMRVSELRLLKIGDFNLDEGYMYIRNAKNHKERKIPVHESLLKKCKEFKDTVHINSTDDEYFFIVRQNVPLSLANIYKNFRRYLDQAGIVHTGHGPRVHDFRHTYCVNLLRKWSDEGKDLMVWLPYMKTMLGHESFNETAYYLKLTAERFPYIKSKLKESFPSIVSEVSTDEHEFY